MQVTFYCVFSELLNTGTLEILEPDDGEFVFTREEKEQVPAQRVCACIAKLNCFICVIKLM